MVASAVVPMATLIYQNFSFYYVDPANALDPNQPCALRAGKTYALGAELLDTSLNPPPSVTCTVEGTEYIIPFSHEDFAGLYWYLLENAWTAPLRSENQTTLIKFEWTATSSDGNATITAEAYGKLTGLEGYFSINGHTVEKDSVIRVYDATVKFGFTATRDAGSIERVFVVLGGPVQHIVELEDMANKTYWETEYTLPETGTYHAKGTVMTEAGSYQLMSILLPWESEDLPFWREYPSKMNELTWIGLGFMILGVAMSFMERKR